MKLFSLGPLERLKSRAALNDLFLHGKSFSFQGFRILYAPAEYNEDFPARAAFVVPSKTIKSAAKRNRIRRQMKEGYRKNKQDLYNILRKKKEGINLAIVYQGNTMIIKGEAEEKIIVLLQRFINDLSSGK